MTVCIIGSAIMTGAHIFQISILGIECEQGSPCHISLVPLILQGLAYTTYAVVLWGSIPYMVEGRTLGTAFGITCVCQNIGTLLVPIILGEL